MKRQRPQQRAQPKTKASFYLVAIIAYLKAYNKPTTKRQPDAHKKPFLSLLLRISAIYKRMQENDLKTAFIVKIDTIRRTQ